MPLIDSRAYPLLVDYEAGERYRTIAETGKRIFNGSALFDPVQSVTAIDVALVHQFLAEVSPQNPATQWRITKADKSLDKGEIVDPSTYGNWEAPGGPLESIELASRAGRLTTQMLKENLKTEESDMPVWAKRAIHQLRWVNPELIAVAGLFHDVGRLVTHIFFTNEVIATPMLRKIGLREDIIRILPAESVMLTPANQSMDEVIEKLSAGAVLVRLADEFGKRVPETNRVYQPEDFDQKQMQAWAGNYASRPFSGRTSEAKWREQRQLHVDNVPRYFQALDNWVQGVSTLTLKDVTVMLEQQLSPTLAPLP